MNGEPDTVEPEVALSCNHDALEEAVQFITPAPIFEMNTFCAAGFDVAANPEKFRVVGDRTRVGPCTANVTLMVCGLFKAPGEMICTVPV